MTVSRDDVITGYPGELAGFEALIRPLEPQQWSAPTRCEGWVVRDVAAHVAGTHAAIVAGDFAELAAPGHVERQLAARASASAGDVADEINGYAGTVLALLAAFDDDAWAGPAPGGLGLTLGHAVQTLWYDLYVHADDVRSALDRPSDRGPGVRASVHHIATALSDRRWPGATLALDGVEEIEVSGGGRRVTGDPVAFVLAATGRADPALLGLDSTVNIYG